MTRLYPRLLPSEVGPLFARIDSLSPTDIEALPEASPRHVFAAAGGDRVGPDWLVFLRSELTACAREYGYPDSARSEDLVAFDRTLARWLHDQLEIGAGEASSRAVWPFLTLVTAPHVAAWRFPTRGSSYTRERFDGTDLTRNAFARLWWRAEVLRDNTKTEGPYELLDVLGEEAIDQLMARRRSLAASPGLARSIARVTRERMPEMDRTVFRDALQRLLRLSAFIDFDSLDDVALLEAVGEEFDASARALASPPPSG